MAGIVFLAIGIFLVLICREPSSTVLVENIFSRGIYTGISHGLSALTSLVPFSVAEVLVWGVVIAVLCRLIRGIVCAAKTPDKLSDYWKEMFSGVFLWGGVILTVYLMFGGLNYYRASFVQYASMESDFEVIPSSSQELAELCVELARQANALSFEVQRDEDGGMVLSEGFDAMTDDVRQGYIALEGQYDDVLCGGAIATPKPVEMSLLMSYGRITGMYFFFTGEANVNTNAPDYTIPATAAHELAHVCGFMREDEANYIAFVACRAAEEAHTRYSGLMLALSHSLNALARSDAQAYAEVMEDLSHFVQRDFELHNRYWDQYETPVGEVAQQANDLYLRANSQEDGVKSYGRMVDLLLADYRADGKI